MRLDKAVSLAGLTRSQAKKALSCGRVAVNGAPRRNGADILSPSDRVTLDGQEILLKEQLHLMMNKPAGVLTATEDGRGERTVVDLLPEKVAMRGVAPAGRLDKDVTGMLILTTDGELAHRLISPKRGIAKVYTARVEGRLDSACVEAFRGGIAFKDFTALPAELEILSAGETESLCRVTVSEGKYHQVKRMLSRVGHEVLALRRDSVCGIALDPALSEGQWRELTAEEEAHLYQSTGMTE